MLPVRLLRVVLPTAYVAAVLYPVYVFFAVRGGLAWINELDATSVQLALFPLIGLIAFALLWLQFLIGSSMRPLRSLYPHILKFHRSEGVFILVLIFVHPLLLVSGLGLPAYIEYLLSAPQQTLLMVLGYTAQLLILTTVATALLLRSRLFVRRWRYIHLLNYLAFILVWIHSWFLGSDVQTTNLKYYWLFVAVTAVMSTFWRLQRSRSPVHT
jgi:sulfoxide reductase heme-binding subunit YedZ